MVPSDASVPQGQELSVADKPKKEQSSDNSVPQVQELSVADKTQNEQHSDSNSEEETDVPIFQVLAANIIHCLVMSDLKRNKSNDGASTGWTSWADEASSFRLQSCVDYLSLSVPTNPDTTNVELLEKRDEAQRWIRWMKNSPSPMILELSVDLREAVNQILDDASLSRIESGREEFLERISCRLVLLPSGTELVNPLRTPPGALAFGKLLYGGVTRYRILGSAKTKRRAGERSLVYDTKIKSWLQYGGPERNFEAMDMGSCALLEVIIAPYGVSLPILWQDGAEMALTRMQWNPNVMFDYVKEEEEDIQDVAESPQPETLLRDGDSNDGSQIEEWESSFASSVGGLQGQIEAIVRRVLDGRVIRPLSEINDSDASLEGKRAIEAKALAELGLQPVRGLLLYGPPGCGKTALAREISRCLDARPPKIVAAPELLDRWVGGSEKLVRELFSDAESELRLCNGDATKSALHVIVIDEIDAVFRKRTAGEDSGEATRASSVNQILAKLDGVNALGNVLIIGMTNRRELLDDALLRPGRLEVQVKIPLPDQEGRREILQIHFEALRRRGRLSKPLCQAIDGINISSDSNGALPSRWRRRIDSTVSSLKRQGNIRDLASARWTGGFSGADIAGLVRSAGSLALARARLDGGGIDNLLITMEDVYQALEEVKT